MKKQAFTLVELIVVVTILAILATIGFVSYSGYLTGVRDTNRVASLTAISDGLELYRTKNDLPLPDDSVEVQLESDTIARQGYAGSNVLQTIEYSKAGKDPKDDQYYSYYLTDDKKHYQMMAFLEESDNLESRLKYPTQPHPNPLLRGEGIAQIEKNKVIESNVLLPSPLRRGVGGEVIFIGVTHAATNYSNRHPKVYGKRLGILTDSDNTPIQEITTIKTAGNLNIQNTGMVDEYTSHLSDSEQKVGTGTILISRVVGKKVGTRHTSCLDIYNNNPITHNVDGEYTISIDSNTVRVYCNMSDDGGGWTGFYGVIDSMIQEISLAHRPGNFSYGNIDGDIWSSNISGLEFGEFFIQTMRTSGISGRVYPLVGGNKIFIDQSQFNVSNTIGSATGCYMYRRDKSSYGVKNWEVGINRDVNGAMDSGCAHGVGVNTSGVNRSIYSGIGVGYKTIFYVK